MSKSTNGLNGLASLSALDSFQAQAYDAANGLTASTAGRQSATLPRVIFSGEFLQALDQQGRVAIPGRFRAAFLDGIILARSYDRCIAAYTVTEFAVLAGEITSHPVTRADGRLLARLTFSGAHPLVVDRGGRVQVPPELRRYARVLDEVVVVGAGRCLEMWAPEVWAEMREDMADAAADIAEQAGKELKEPRPPRGREARR